MFYKKIFFALVCFVVFTHLLKAQKIHFSQFETLAPVLNPALTGLIPNEGGFRVAAIGRNQWSSFLENESFQTVGVSFDMRNCLSDFICNKIFNGSNFKSLTPTWGLGGHVMRDHSGVHSVRNISDDDFPLVRNYVGLSGSVLIPTSDNLVFTGGFKVGAQFHRLETSHLRYDEQFDNISGFDSSISGEFDGMDHLASNTMDMGGGISVRYLHENMGGVVGGGSINYAFRPVENNFITDDNTPPSLARKWTVHAKASRVVIKGNHTYFSVMPKAVFVHQAPFQQWVFANDFIFQHEDGFTYAIGAGWRMSRDLSDGLLTDAVLGSAMINYRSFSLAFTGDMNISNLRAATKGYGSAEVSVIYHWKKKRSKCMPTRDIGFGRSGRFGNPMGL